MTMSNNLKCWFGIKPCPFRENIQLSIKCISGEKYKLLEEAKVKVGHC